MADRLDDRSEQPLEPMPVLVDDPATAEAEAQAEGEAFLAELKAARTKNTVSLPGLLDL